MAVDVTTLGIGVTTTGIPKATTEMAGLGRSAEKLATDATDAEKAVDRLARAAEREAVMAKKAEDANAKWAESQKRAAGGGAGGGGGAGAAKEAEKAARDAERAQEALGAKAVATGVVIAEAVIGATKLVYGLAEAFVQAGLSLGRYQDLAEQTNSDPAGLASMQVAADVAHVSLESLATMMNRLTQNVSRAKDGTSGAGKALKALGIDAKEFLSLRADEQYKLIAQSMERFADGSGKVAAAQALFGRGGAQQLGMMKELASQGSANNIVTNEMIKRADDLSDAMVRQRSQATLVIKVLSAEGLLGALSDVQVGFLNVAKEVVGLNEATGKIDSKPLEDFANEVVNAMAFAADSVLGLRAVVLATGNAYGAALAMAENFYKNFLTDRDAFRAGNKAITEAVEEDNTKLARSVTTFRDAVAKARAGRESAQRAEDAAWGNEARRNSAKPSLPVDIAQADERAKKAAKEKVGKIPEYMAEYLKLTEAEERFVGKLEEEVAMFGQSKLQMDLYKIALADLTGSERARAEVLAYGLEAKRKDAEIEKARESIIKSNKTAQEQYIERVERAHELLTDEVQLKRELIAADEAYIKTLKKETESLSEMDRFAVKAAENIQDTLATGLADIMEGNFDRIDKAFLKMLNSMVANAIAANLSSQLFGDYGKTGKIGGWLGELMGNVSGSSTAAFSQTASGGAGFGTGFAYGNLDLGGFFAEGGRPPLNRPSVVGENGPELFVPDSAGTIVPNGRFGGSNGIIINQTVNVGGGASYNDVSRAMAAAKDAAKAEIAQSVARGSRVYQ